MTKGIRILSSSAVFGGRGFLVKPNKSAPCAAAAKLMATI
jgi:hypothetical protein